MIFFLCRCYVKNQITISIMLSVSYIVPNSNISLIIFFIRFRILIFINTCTKYVFKLLTFFNFVVYLLILQNKMLSFLPKPLFFCYYPYFSFRVELSGYSLDCKNLYKVLYSEPSILIDLECIQ
jgi:hypothetical protein